MTEQAAPAQRGRRQFKIGTVIGSSMDRTVVVAVRNTLVHDLYKRRIKRTAKFYAHDERNECGVGDRVEIVSSRPLSKLKRWRVNRILERAEGS